MVRLRLKYLYLFEPSSGILEISTNTGISYPVAVGVQLGVLGPVTILPLLPDLHQAVTPARHEPATQQILDSFGKFRWQRLERG